MRQAFDSGKECNLVLRVFPECPLFLPDLEKNAGGLMSKSEKLALARNYLLRRQAMPSAIRAAHANHVIGGACSLDDTRREYSMQENPTNRDHDVGQSESQHGTDPMSGNDAHASAAVGDATRDAATDQLESAGARAAEAELAEAHAQVASLKEDFLRAKAETENVRRRAQEDVSKAHKFAIETFAEHLLPVIDSLEAALADKSEDRVKLQEGVELTLRQLTSALEKGRVAAIQPAVGEKFDPHRHQAISMVPADQEPNTVVTVLQKGFVIADRVLRPALVMVAAPK